MHDDAKLQPYLQFQDVSKAFWRQWSCSIASALTYSPAKPVCILGRSGVGKSVRVAAHYGFSQIPIPDVSWCRPKDITGYKEAQMEGIRKKVTMVFQNGALFDSLTVL